MELTPEQRAPLVLRAFADCSYEQIAAMLGLTAQAVRGRLHRAGSSCWSPCSSGGDGGTIQAPAEPA